MDRLSEEQVAMYYPRLFRTALRLTGNREDSADLTQQAFCKAVSHWGQFDGKCQPATWLHGILINCVRDWFRGKARRNTKEFHEWALVNTASVHEGADETLDRVERLGRLRQAIEALSEDLRRPFVAAVIDGHTYKEVAEMLSIPVGTVAYRVYQARRNLRDVMLESFPEV